MRRSQPSQGPHRTRPVPDRGAGRFTTRVLGFNTGRVTPLHWALAALVLVSVGRVHDHVALLAVLRPGLLLTAICLALYLVNPGSVRLKNNVAALPARLILVLAGVIGLAAVTGLSLGASASFIVTVVLPVMVFFVLLTASMRNVADLRLSVFAYVSAVLAVGMASVFLSNAMYFDGYTRQGGAGMYDGNDIGVVFLVGLPLATVLLRSRGWGSRVTAWAAVFFAILALLLAASRGGFLGLIFGGTALLILSPGWTVVKKAGIALGVFGAVSLLAPDGYWQLMGSLLSPADDYNVTSDTGRIAIWTRGLGYVAQYPVLGLGPDNFIRAGWTISDVGSAGLAGAGLANQVAHNTFLQVWAELGTVGLAVWLAIIATGVILPLRMRRDFPASWLNSGTPEQRFLVLMSSYLPASYIGFSVTSFFVTHAYTSLFYALTAILAGFVLVGREMLKQVQVVGVAPTRRRRGPRRAGWVSSAPRSVRRIPSRGVDQ